MRRDIEGGKYNFAGCFKANRLRQFWKVKPNAVLGTLVKAMVDFAKTLRNVNESLFPVGRKIAARLLDSVLVTGAALDRLTHRCQIIEATGESYRLKDA